MCINYHGNVPAVTGIFRAGTRLVPAGTTHYRYIWYVQVPGSPVAYVSRVNILIHSHCDVPRTGDNNEAMPRERSDRGRFFAFRQKSLFMTGRKSIGCQKSKSKHFSVPGMSVIQHRNWPLRSTVLNAHGTNASPDGLRTRTHTNEAFSCWLCCNSFRVDRDRRGNVCL